MLPSGHKCHCCPPLLAALHSGTGRVQAASRAVQRTPRSCKAGSMACHATHCKTRYPCCQPVLSKQGAQSMPAAHSGERAGQGSPWTAQSRRLRPPRGAAQTPALDSASDLSRTARLL